MGPPQLTMMEELRRVAAATGHRLGMYYSRAGMHEDREVGVVIHSKVLAVDDRFLTIGSANASNRSLGLDTELNLAWHASLADKALCRAIHRILSVLLDTMLPPRTFLVASCLLGRTWIYRYPESVGCRA